MNPSDPSSSSERWAQGWRIHRGPDQDDVIFGPDLPNPAEGEPVVSQAEAESLLHQERQRADGLKNLLAEENERFDQTFARAESLRQRVEDLEQEAYVANELLQEAEAGVEELEGQLDYTVRKLRRAEKRVEELTRDIEVLLADVGDPPDECDHGFRPPDDCPNQDCEDRDLRQAIFRVRAVLQPRSEGEQDG